VIVNKYSFRLLPAVALICGILFGPICAHFIDVHTWGNEEEITHQLTRFVIGIQVMATGVALPRAYLRRELASILILLGPVMIYMWLISGLLVWGLIPGLNFVSNLGTPTSATLVINAWFVYSLKH
jgi:NhaP-type Na+/H+ or K+/H+ antiporter